MSTEKKKKKKNSISELDKVSPNLFVYFFIFFYFNNIDKVRFEIYNFFSMINILYH